ncbi:universal stress protein, partial [Salmonella enterica subsp. enterica serovar Kentucky]|nr:universal stress protein [Salmonella enterica subsp. enterica serovar Kentucky]
VQAYVAEGSPKDKILEMAKKLPADMVIIASHRPDITTYLLGSSTKKFSYSGADSSQLSAQAITDHTLRRYLTNINYFFCLIRKL